LGFTHYFEIVNKKGMTQVNEMKYSKAILDCQRIVRHYYKENGGLSGYTAHSPIGAYGGLKVNGKGNDAHEDFTMREHFAENEGFNFCKTARKPYDMVVVACLAVLAHRLGDAFKVSSDGEANEWTEGVRLARDVTGLKIGIPLGVLKKGE
jgi:hypothetical protein